MRNNQRIFIFLFTFFIVVALGSLIFLGGRGSAFDKTRESLGSGTAALSQTITGLFGGEDEDNTAEVTAPVIEQAEKEEPVIQEPAVEETPVEEPVEEEPAEAADSFEIRYFTFVTDTHGTNLHIRQDPSESAMIISRLKDGSHGFVLKPGNDWCRIVIMDGTEGYCATEYLKLTEVTKDEFYDKYVDKVEAPEEELSSRFGN